MSRLSIIIPTLNEETGIADALEALAPLHRRGTEVIVVDGGSHDGTIERARRFATRVLSAPRGRAAQMNVGAAAAVGDVLLFLHADTTLPEGADDIVLYGLTGSIRNWGRFDVVIEGRHPLLPVVAGLMNLRSQFTGIATGDHAIFVTKAAFDNVGGFPDIPLMEDIALSKRLKRLGRPLCLVERVTTSGRRWERHGVLATIMLMWRLRLAYAFGAEPAALAQRYGYVQRDR
ncbi:MAG: TIGR04283 family arsenosugar biosynthesis glycosyltransferase [Xanthobacteraceae bacterium]